MARIDCLAVLKALSEVTRMRVLRLLLNDRLSVNDLADRLKLSQYNVSKHLRVLKTAGLVEVEKNGKQHFYSVASHLRTHLAENRNVLELKCCTFRFDELPW